MDNAITKLKVGYTGRIKGFTDDEIAGKLMVMGVLPGSRVQVVRIAPFKGGYYLRVDGVNMAVREQEADSIIMTVDV